MKIILFLMVSLGVNFAAEDGGSTNAESVVFTTSTVLEDYHNMMALIDNPNRSEEQLLASLMDMLNQRAFVDREILICMHSLLPEEFYGLLLGYDGDPEKLFPLHAITSSTQIFTHTFDRKVYRVLTLQEMRFWDQTELRKFVQDSYRFLIYHVTSLNHLNRNVLHLDEDNFKEIINSKGVNKPNVSKAILELSVQASQYRKNFNDNFRYNLAAFGVPDEMWSEDISSSLYIGNQDWIKAQCEGFIKTAGLVLSNSVNLDQIPENDLLYCYFIFLYRAQAYTNMAATLLDHITELYVEQNRVESDYYKRQRDLESLNMELDQTKKQLEQLKERHKAAQKNSTKTMQAIQKLQKEMNDLERKIIDGSNRVNESRQKSLNHPDKIKIHKKLLDEKVNERQSVEAQLENLKVILDNLSQEVEKLRAREDHREEYVKASAELRKAEEQRDQIQGIYEVFLQNSGQEHLRLENARLKIENADLDAEIARLEAELAGD